MYVRINTAEQRKTVGNVEIQTWIFFVCSVELLYCLALLKFYAIEMCTFLCVAIPLGEGRKEENT